MSIVIYISMHIIAPRSVSHKCASNWIKGFIGNSVYFRHSCKIYGKFEGNWTDDLKKKDLGRLFLNPVSIALEIPQVMTSNYSLHFSSPFPIY